LDLNIFGNLNLDWQFFSALFSIIVINIILSGDNAVVIALAVKSLPHNQRQKGIVIGAGAAVLLRVILTFFVAKLLLINYLKIIGGLLILWIAVKLFVEGVPEEDENHQTMSVWQAVKLILIADITMATDNMLAVAAASNGSLFLLLFGLGLSIPLVVFASSLLSMLMDKYPIIVYIGAAILGKVGGEMIITDPFTVGLLHPSTAAQYGVELFFAVAVIVVGKLYLRWKNSRSECRVQKDCPAEELAE
jgi:YjbE family integral membrane protein